MAQDQVDVSSGPKTKLEEQATSKGAYSYSYFASSSQASVSAPAPRKLTDEEVQAQLELERQASAKGTSTWNHAGTFEERSWGEWAKDRVKALLRGASAGSVQVTDVSSVTGDANTWLVRGKKRAGFDFEISVNWSTQVSGTEIKGTAKVPNAASDDLDDLSVASVEVTGKEASRAAAEAAAVRTVTKELPAKVAEVLTQLLEELKAK